MSGLRLHIGRVRVHGADLDARAPTGPELRTALSAALESALKTHIDAPRGSPGSSLVERVRVRMPDGVTDGGPTDLAARSSEALARAIRRLVQ